MMVGISIRPNIGIGDGLQFSSLPENYFRAHGKRLLDISWPWFFDHNPYVVRIDERNESVPHESHELWNFPKTYEWPRPRSVTYLSNAEIWASYFRVPTPLIRPRLYRFEEFPFKERKKILFHVEGRSQGRLPQEVIDHVVNKYRDSGELYQIGPRNERVDGIPSIDTPSLWSMAEEISKARMFIGPDSGPAWIAACYPDVVVKKVRCKWQQGFRTTKDWVPLEIENHHSHWDDRAFQIHNTTEDDIGFTLSYKKI